MKYFFKEHRFLDGSEKKRYAFDREIFFSAFKGLIFFLVLSYLIFRPIWLGGCEGLLLTRQRRIESGDEESDRWER
jgi:hypothetical protein